MADAWQAAMSEQMRGWNAKPPPPAGPEPLSGQFRVSLAELGLDGEDAIVDFYRFMRDTTHRAAGGGVAANRDHPVVALMEQITACLRAGGPIAVGPVNMTRAELFATKTVLRAAVTNAGMSYADWPRHVRDAAERLAGAWERFSGTRGDPRSQREQRQAWGPERGWIDF